MALEDRYLEAGERTRQVMPKMIRVLLAAREQTSSAAAAALGMSPGSFSERMSRKARFTAEEVGMLAEFLDVDPGLLYKAPEEAFGPESPRMYGTSNYMKDIQEGYGDPPRYYESGGESPLPEHQFALHNAR